MQWKPKEFSKLTKVSVRTLHHYDEIGLLKPSARLLNGYRLYSEDDLLKLERIIALKFFGFGLRQIKVLVKNDQDVLDSFKAQQLWLDEQVKHLGHANAAIQKIVAEITTGNAVEWPKIAQLIEVFRMTKELNASWAGQVYSQEQLKQFAELKQRYSEKEMAAYQERWAKLLAEVQKNLDQDPTGPVGQKLAKAWMDLLDEMYGDSPELKDAMSMAYKYNRIPDAPFDQKLWTFIEKAVKALPRNK